MLTILEVFGGLEGFLLLFCLVGFVVNSEIEKLIPMAIFVYGTAFLAAAFLITVVVHDHVHLSVGVR